MLPRSNSKLSENTFIQNLQEYSFLEATLNVNVNIFFELKDLDLQNDFHAFGLYTRSSLLLKVLFVIFLFVIFPCEIYLLNEFYSSTNTMLSWGNQVLIWCYVCSFGIVMLSIRSAWYELQDRHNIKNIHHGNNTMFLLSMTLFVIFRILRASLIPCHYNPMVDTMIGRECLNHGFDIFTWDIGAYLIGIPIIILFVMKETRFRYVILSFLSIFIVISVVTLSQHPRWFGSLILWCFLGSFLLFDIHYQNIKTYFLKRKLIETLMEKEETEVENHAIEMRHMIANVAHDLKTPLASFTSGIDLIEQTIIESEELCEQHSMIQSSDLFADKIKTLSLYLQDIRHTNSFMVMIINRCIDYSKTSNGIKLIPRYETLDLIHTLRLPLTCMKNIQSRISIQLNPITEEICSHIMTDKQWLQENILCLLSNAVKFSFKGKVTLTVSLFQPRRDLSGLDSQQPESVLNSSNKPSCGKYPFFPSLLSHNKVFPDTKPRVTSTAFKLLSSLSHSITSSVSSCETSQATSNQSSCNSSIRLPGHPSIHKSTHCSMRDTYSQNYSNHFGTSLRYYNNTKNPFHIKFEVEDTGIGMSDEAMKSLFSPFKQHQRLTGGTGLGLFSLARRIEALDGKYGVKRRKDGKQGSLFWFSFPYKPDDVMASTFKKDDIGFRVACINESNDMCDSPSTPLPSLLPSMAKQYHISPLTSPRQEYQQLKDENLKILIVEDSLPVLKMTSVMIKKIGHDVFLAENGAIAVEMIEERFKTTGKVFDMVLMDLQMPVMDGIEATRRIRSEELLHYKKNSGCYHSSSINKLDGIVERSSDKSTVVINSTFQKRPHQIIVATSANSDHDTMEEAFKAGVDAFIAKPFTIDMFHYTIRDLGLTK